MGSGELVRSLLAAGLLDVLTLLIHPVVLGTGCHLLDGGGSPSTLQLSHSVSSPTGVVIATYRAA